MQKSLLRGFKKGLRVKPFGRLSGLAILYTSFASLAYSDDEENISRSPDKTIISCDLAKYKINCRPIGQNRHIFNIKGNSYRLVVKINFDLKTVWIRFIGTHDEYDRINALEI